MLWIALSLWPLTSTSPSPPDPPAEAVALPQYRQALQALSWWALQFSPRVCVLEGAVLLEVDTSLRLFGGEQALLAQLHTGAGAWAKEHAAVVASAEGQAPPLPLRMASASTALAALALLKTQAADSSHCAAPHLHALLDSLRLDALAAALPHHVTLQQLGCRTLGDVRRLPRGGVSRRFGADLLAAMDRAYGLKLESYPWVTLPDQFHVRLEFTGRIEVAAGLMFGVNRLLLQLKAWLTARHSGVTGLRLHWAHDLQRRSAAQAGSHTVQTAQATREVPHLARLLAEHLARLKLVAPVVAISLEALGVEALSLASASLLPEDQQTGESLHQFIERVSARLGSDKVLQGVPMADHRPHRMQRWVPATAQPPARSATPQQPGAPQASHPPWLLHPPLKLTMAGDKPLYQGPLTLLAGPERIEAGWWDERDDLTLRDYFIAQSEQAGLVWVYRERWGSTHEGGSAWYLHGLYG